MRTNRSLLLLVVLALLAMTAIPAAAQESLIEKVCLVTDVGKVNDGTFNQYAYDGMMRAVEDFGLDSTYIETQAQTDYRTNLARCIDDGFEAIVTVGFLLADETMNAAAEYPNVFFIGVDQFVPDGSPANYTGLQFREDQAGYMAGVLAASVSETGVIGGVYGIDVPAVKKFRHGYEQGARSVNPDITVLGVYIDSFIAPDRGATAAGQFLGEGADVIFGAGGPTGSGAITRAAQEGALVIGVDQDEFLTTFGNGTTPGAENLISSAMKRVDVAVYTAIEALVEGGADFPGGTNLVMSAENDGIGLAPTHLAEEYVTPEIQAVLDATLAGLKDGTRTTGVNPVSGDMNILGAASAAGNFLILGLAVEFAGLSGALDGEGPFTVFAPTDDAFMALPEGALDDLAGDLDALTAVLTYHVVPGAVLAADVVGLSAVTTLQGADITITVENGKVLLNGEIEVIATDIVTGNGVIHVINGVLLPPG